MPNAQTPFEEHEAFVNKPPNISRTYCLTNAHTFVENKWVVTRSNSKTCFHQCPATQNTFSLSLGARPWLGSAPQLGAGIGCLGLDLGQVFLGFGPDALFVYLLPDDSTFLGECCTERKKLHAAFYSAPYQFHPGGARVGHKWSPCVNGCMHLCAHACAPARMRA
jgi:hypothetical protein